MRFPQPFGLKAILVGLGSVALFASSAKSQENPLIHEASVPIGEVGAFAENFGWFPLFPAVSSRVTFDNNRTLTIGPGELSFFVDCPSCLLGYAGELLDATGTPIPGTMYTGVVNGDAAKIELSQTTTFSGMSFVPLGDISQTFGLVWVTPPTVGEPPSGDEAPVAAAGGPYSGTAGVDVAFDGSGSSDDLSITTYEWAFGDGQMGVGVAPVHNYATADTYNVTLTVRDGGGLASSDNTTATIGATDVPPVADAGGDYAGTVGEPVSFDGSGSSDDVGIASYAWDFGDASPLGTGVSPQHMYASAGPYTVQLTVTDASGNDAVDSAAVSIGEGNLPPEADAGPPVSGLAGVAVAFDGSGSSDPGGAITEYLWNFGDGSPTVNGGPTPDHTYARFGAYEVTLRVTDPNDGAVSDTDYTTADIVADNQAPVAEANGPYAGSVGVAVLFDSSGSVDPDGMIDTYVWSFGDGTSGLGDSPSHAYADDGNYNVSLLVIDDDGTTAMDFASVSIDASNLPPTADPGGPYSGLVGVPVSFDGSASSDPEGELASLAWDFGDGASGSGSQPVHTYEDAGAYVVTVTAKDGNGATDQAPTLAVIASGDAPPMADAGGPYQGTAGVAVTFDGSGSSDTEGDIISYDWIFQDGEMRSGVSVTHTYSTSGEYNVTLTVTDAMGQPSSDSAVASIGALSQPPTASAGGPYVGRVDAAVTFDGTGSSDDGTIASYAWDFGDGTMGVGSTPTHTYTTAGCFVVGLTVTDDDGQIGPDSSTVEIGQGDLPPQADDGGPYFGLPGVAVEFDGGSSSDPDGAVATYTWAFGDGMTDTGATPSHVYASSGVYIVTLTVEDGSGLVDSDTTVATLFDDTDGDGVPNEEDSDNDNDGIKDKKDVDKDGDGWDVFLEDEAGTSDWVSISVPEGGTPGARGPGTKKVTVKLNRKKTDADSIVVNGTMPVAEDFDPAGVTVSFEFDEGAFVRDYTLDDKGKFNDKTIGENVSFSKPKRLKQSETYVSNFKFKAKKQDLADVFPQFVNADEKDASVQLTVAVTLDGATAINRKSMSYNSKLDKNGTAKQPKPPKPPKE